MIPFNSWGYSELNCKLPQPQQPVEQRNQTLTPSINKKKYYAPGFVAMQIRFPVVVEKDILGPKIKLRNKQNSGDDYLCQFRSLL